MKKWITKKEVTKILDAYSVRKDEFEQVREQDYFYQSRILKGYTITLSEEKQEGKNISIKTGRIIVTHARTNGKKTFQDIWERDKNNQLQFIFRNPWNMPFTDVEFIRDLEEKNRQLMQAGSNLQEQLKQRDSQKLNNENIQHKEQIVSQERIACLEEEIQKLRNKTAHNARGAGRKPSRERQIAIDRLKAMLDEGKSDTEIQEQLNISKATFYRYRKSITN